MHKINSWKRITLKFVKFRKKNILSILYCDFVAYWKTLICDIDESAFKKSGFFVMSSHPSLVTLVVIVGARNHAMMMHIRDSHLIDAFWGIYRAEYIKDLFKRFIFIWKIY